MLMKSTLTVVVLTPPPVEPGLAPTNINTHAAISMLLEISLISTVLNPAVLKLTDWKKLASNFSPTGKSLRL